MDLIIVFCGKVGYLVGVEESINVFVWDWLSSYINWGKYANYKLDFDSLCICYTNLGQA